MFFKKAVAIDPAFARAYFLLAKNADQRGEWAAQRLYLKAAVDSNPDEPKYLLQYGYAQKKSDPSRFREIALQVVDRFPASQSAAQALYYLAGDAPNPERRAIYDRLRADYPFDWFGYSASAMYKLYAELTQPSEALLLAREMAKALPTNKTWQTRVTVQEAMVGAESLVADARFADALETPRKTRAPSGSHGTTWTLLKADAAAGSGHVDQAYAALLDSAVALPDARARRGPAEIRDDARQDTAGCRHRCLGAARCQGESRRRVRVPSARDGSLVKLADYRGRVVLLAFWFPG